MAELEDRVSHLEKEVAELQGQLKSDMKNIERRFDELSSDLRTLFGKMDNLNSAIASINTTGELAKQSSSSNEKLVWALGAFGAGILSFMAGKLL